MRLFPITLFSLLMAAGCSDRQTGIFDGTDLDDQYAYFPLEKGRFLEYSVDSLVYDFVSGGTLIDSTRLYVRELLTDTLHDLTGQTVFTLERYERPRTDTAWALRRVWTAGRNATEAWRTEENLRFIRLIFPFNRRSAWDGNRWIETDREIEVAGERIRPYANWQYEVDSLDLPGTIGPFAYDSLLYITEVDDINAIERRLSKAVYAHRIGLVYREQWILDSQYCNQDPPPFDCLTKPWREKAERGYILRQTLTGHN